MIIIIRLLKKGSRAKSYRPAKQPPWTCTHHYLLIANIFCLQKAFKNSGLYIKIYILICDRPYDAG